MTRPRDLPRLRDSTAKATVSAEALWRRTNPALARQAGGDAEEFADAMRVLRRRLQASSLYWVTQEMTDVALSASATLPEWTLGQAIPADVGLLIWDEGLPPIEWPGAPERLWVGSGFGTRKPPRLTVDGVLWVRIGDGVAVQMFALTDRVQRDLEGALAGTAGDGPLFFFADIGRGGDLGRGDLPVIELEEVRGDLAGDGDRVLAVLGATWLMMSQPSLASVSRESTRGGAGRRPPLVDVSVISLRRATVTRDEPPTPTGRHLTHRHIVQGHWRQQACGPERSERKPLWIHDHVKGPEGAPLLHREQVRVWHR